MSTFFSPSQSRVNETVTTVSLPLGDTYCHGTAPMPISLDEPSRSSTSPFRRKFSSPDGPLVTSKAQRPMNDLAPLSGSKRPRSGRPLAPASAR
eukprot:77408-Prymnesium_polylepis.2